MCIHICTLCVETPIPRNTNVMEDKFCLCNIFLVYLCKYMYITLYLCKVLNYMLHCRQVVNCKLVNC